MGILDSLFGKKTQENQPEIPNYYQLITDLVIDWFEADKLSIDDFDKGFKDNIWDAYYEKCAQRDYHPEYYTLFTPFAIYYLFGLSASPKRDSERLSHIFKILNDANLSNYSKEDFFSNIRHFGVDENIADSKYLRKGENTLRIYMKLVEQIGSSAEYIIVQDLDYYIPFLKELPIDRLSVFAKLYLYNGKETDDGFAKPDVLSPLIEEEIINRNKKSSVSIDYNITIDFLNLLNFRYTPEWHEISNQKKIDVSKVPVFADFISRSKAKESIYLSCILHFMREDDLIPYDWGNVLQQMVMKIIGDNKFEPEWAFEVFAQIKFSFTKYLGKIIENIREQLEYEDRLVLLYEEYCLGNFNQYNWLIDKKDLMVLDFFYQKIQDKRIRDLYLKRIYGIKLISKSCPPNYSSNHCWIHNDEKLEETKQLIGELNLILPITIKSTNTREYSYDGHNVTRAHLVCDGEEISITDERLEELNNILADKNTGYQLVSIPITEESDGRNIYTLGALAICNYEEYKFVESIFNTAQAFNALFSKIRYTKTDAISFDKLRETKSSLPQDDSFIGNSNWQWFKNSYIDKLSSKEKWYNVMDLIITCSGTKSLNKKWADKLSVLISEFPEQQYYRELQSMLSESLNEDFWFYDIYQKGLKGLIWSCTFNPSESSLNIIRLIIEKAYTKVAGIGPRCTVIGNFGINVLVDTGREEAFGLLNIMRNKTKYNRFVVALDKAIDKFKETSDIPEQLLADKTIPKFEFVNNERFFELGDFSLHLFFDKGKLQKEWLDKDGKAYKSVPSIINEEYTSQLKELNNEVKQINQLFKDLNKRIRTYWLYNRSWKAKDWTEYILEHPLINQHIENMIWTNVTKKEDFIVIGNRARTIEGDIYNIDPTDELILWHPVVNSTENIAQWQNFMWQNKIIQKERQAFREFYPFSDKEKELSDSQRFANHFLEVNKLMAIANNQGWIFTYVHEGYNWPRIYLKQPDITFHLKSDYSRNEYAMPTQEIFVTKGNTVKIEYSNHFDKIPFEEIPVATLSELCRDVDLFIATTTVANNPDLAKRQIYNSYYQNYEKGLFSENASAAIRKQILTKLVPLLNIKSDGFAGNFMLVNGTVNSYKINLGSGFAQTKEGEHLNLLLSTEEIKKNKKISLPIEDDDILYLIIAKALLLTNDKDISDTNIQEIIRGR